MDTRTTKKQAILRSAIFLADRVNLAIATGDNRLTTKEAIQSLLELEFAGVLEVEEDDGK